MYKKRPYKRYNYYRAKYKKRNKRNKKKYYKKNHKPYIIEVFVRYIIKAHKIGGKVLVAMLITGVVAVLAIRYGLPDSSTKDIIKDVGGIMLLFLIFSQFLKPRIKNNLF